MQQRDISTVVPLIPILYHLVRSYIVVEINRFENLVIMNIQPSIVCLSWHILQIMDTSADEAQYVTTFELSCGGNEC